MTYRPQTPIAGVVYPDPADLQFWSEQGALTSETLADGFRAAAEAHAGRNALVWLGGRIPKQSSLTHR